MSAKFLYSKHPLSAKFLHCIYQMSADFPLNGLLQIPIMLRIHFCRSPSAACSEKTIIIVGIFGFISLFL